MFYYLFLKTFCFRRLRFSSDADIVRLTNARIIIIIIIIETSLWYVSECAVLMDKSSTKHVFTECNRSTVIF